MLGSCPWSTRLWPGLQDLYCAHIHIMWSFFARIWCTWGSSAYSLIQRIFTVSWTEFDSGEISGQAQSLAHNSHSFLCWPRSIVLILTWPFRASALALCATDLPALAVHAVFSCWPVTTQWGLLIILPSLLGKLPPLFSSFQLPGDLLHACP